MAGSPMRMHSSVSGKADRSLQSTMARNTELTFVHQFSGDAPKRRRLAKACESCRARKKRCIHFGGAGKDAAEDDDQDGAVAQTRATDSGYEQTPPGHATSKKFFSDMNPETALLTRGANGNGLTPRPNEDLGIWVDRREWDALVKQKNDAEATTEQQTTRDDQRPHSAVLGPLIDVYFKKIHPLLPLVEEAEFRESHAGGLVPEPLAHAMCLIAAKDVEALPHLRLNDSADPIPPREFCRRMYASVMGALKATCRYDKVMLIRILALASMHSDGPDGCEEASMCLSQAMHHAQTLGIHLGQQQGHLDLAMKRLFWCLWILDRTSSAMFGRPLLMSDIDIANEPFAPGQSGFPAFDAYYRIADILNKVINFYRPHNPVDTTGWEDEFPGLEEIFDDVGAWSLPESVIATLHMFYLTVAILSHRCRGIKQIPRGTHSSIRQRLCASEVIRFMESDHQQTLHPLPCIPYAVALSLSVQYQHLRQSQISHQQEDAHKNFRAATRILQSLRRTWCSADTMATLAKKVLDELDRAPSLVAFRIPRDAQLRQVMGVDEISDEVLAPPTACAGARDISASMANQTNGTQALQKPPALDGVDLFDGMDDIFGTYLDPNYPVNLDDFSFVEDNPSFDWGQMTGTES